MSQVKPNVGHSEGASGLTSIIKAALCLEKRMIPPNMRFSKPNPKSTSSTLDWHSHFVIFNYVYLTNGRLVPFEKGKLRVPEELLPWPQDREERVSVNSFGIGGSNAHVSFYSRLILYYCCVRHL
jgi:acyl transferase domain-containing protein